MNKPTSCGLDFGTSNSVICAFPDGPGTTPVVISEPTVLFFPERKTSETFRFFVGEEAVTQYVSSGMRGRFIQSLKSVLHDPDFESTIIYGVPYTPIELTTLITKHLKQRLETEIGGTVDTVVMGRPVFFSEDPHEDHTAQRRIRAAAKRSGFEHISFQLEPIGAAYSYETRLTSPQTVLVMDLGGGTTDFTVMTLDPHKLSQADRSSDILATGGVHIGGDDFDATLMWHQLAPHFGYGSRYEDWGKYYDFPIHFFTTLCTWYDIAKLKDSPFKEDLNSILRTSTDKPAVQRLKTLIQEDLGFGVFKSIEKAKKELSHVTSSVIKFSSPHLNFSIPIGQDKFEAMISELIDQIDVALTDTLQRADKTPDQIDSILMTGGTSFVKRIQDYTKARFGEDKIFPDTNRFTGVAMGLAVAANPLS